MLSRQRLKRKDFQALPYGIQSEIARNLEVSPSLVSRVLRGQAKSAKVQRAIEEARNGNGHAAPGL